jgi:hypothetical protein
MNATPTAPLTDRFAWMIERFCKMIGNEAHARRVDGPVALAAWTRFRLLGRRFVALVAAWQAGTLRAVGPARPRPAAARIAGPRPLGLLPRGMNWFCRLFPDTAAPLSGTLLNLLHNDPRIAELAAATPRAGRILRPMCWMLGVKPPSYLQLPRRPRCRPRPVQKAAAKPETPEQVDARVARMSRLAFANLIHPERENMNGRPPNRIGYGRAPPILRRPPKRD